MAASLVLGGCGRKTSSGKTVANELRYPMRMEPATLDGQASDSLWTSELLANVYESLVTLDEKTHAAPCLADSWDISKDGLVYTFHLNPAARFHNGRTVTAADIKYSLDRWCWPETKAPGVETVMKCVAGGPAAMAGKARSVDGVRVINDKTVTITLDRPRAYFLTELTGASIVCREAIENNGGVFGVSSAVGTGPFKLAEYRPGRRLILEANKQHYRGRPPLDRIIRPIVLSPDTIHVMYEKNEIDIAQINATDFANDLQSDLQKQCAALPTGNLNFVGMNANLQPVFKDPRVRLGMAKAIDRDAVSRIAFRGISPRADSLLPPGVLGHNPSIRLPYDPEGARRLLLEAGYPGGRGFPKITLIFISSNPTWAVIGQIVRDDLKKNLGITIDLREQEEATVIGEMNQSRLPFFLMGWTAVDPYDFITLLHTGAQQNHLGYGNPKFDELCDKGDAEVDSNRRAEFYRQADAVATGDAGVIPLVNNRQAWLVKPYVKDLRSNLGGWLPHYTTRIDRK